MRRVVQGSELSSPTCGDLGSFSEYLARYCLANNYYLLFVDDWNFLIFAMLCVFPMRPSCCAFPNEPETSGRTPPDPTFFPFTLTSTVCFKKASVSLETQVDMRCHFWCRASCTVEGFFEWKPPPLFKLWEGNIFFPSFLFFVRCATCVVSDPTCATCALLREGSKKSEQTGRTNTQTPGTARGMMVPERQEMVTTLMSRAGI